MTTYYVATLTRYVLVEAENETQACQLGSVELRELYADLRQRFGCEVPIDIRTVRPATNEEIDLWNWHHTMVAKETGQAPPARLSHN